MGPFQCHHGVPASRGPQGGLPGREGVSMPPRRSCFVQFPPGGVAHPPVSMPPRRSCFAADRRPPHDLVQLFQCHHGVPASRSRCLPGQRRIRVSMPPRRSCFPEEARRGRNGRAGFQCHHGVPASMSPLPQRATSITFQCHHGVPASSWGEGPSGSLKSFQCHHGVPASPLVGSRLEPSRPGFNATTAFLLPGLDTSRPGTRSPVSMPPRRSCFSGGRGMIAYILLLFQCHHGVPASRLE